MNFLNRGNVQTMRCLQLAIALSNISTEQTFKQHHGVNVCVQKLMFHRQLVMAGRLKTMTSWRLPGWHDCLLHNHWSSVLSASAKLDVWPCVVHVEKLNWSAPTCVRVVIVRMQDLGMEMMMTMTTFTNGVALPDDEELGESDLDFEDGDDDLWHWYGWQLGWLESA